MKPRYQEHEGDLDSGALFLCCAACVVGPDYQRPDAPVPEAYKATAGWKTAQPADAVGVHQGPTDRPGRAARAIEHALALLIGKPASAFSLASAPFKSIPPPVPHRPAVGAS